MTQYCYKCWFSVIQTSTSRSENAACFGKIKCNFRCWTTGTSWPPFRWILLSIHI